MALEIRSLAKSFGRKQVLADVNATFPTGITLLTGPSGAGKSTLLRILATADKPSSGEILWKGLALPRARGALRKVLGYAPQSVDLPEALTAREFGLHMAALKGLELGMAEAQFASILERMNLLADIDRRILGFSGGMRRRLVTAQSLLGSPQVIALDEPTAELDSESAAITHSLLKDRSDDAVIVMTTHLAKELAPHAVQNLRVDDGKAVPAAPVTA